MLQQTRVETVRDRFGRFLREFPDVFALASAPWDRVMKAWEGLGYYARARNLKRAAEAVVRGHGGRLPEDEPTLRTLPGFGPYTAAAVSSIAFGRPHAVVDGNVERVVVRLLDEPRSPLRPEVGRRVARAAQALLDPSRPGDWNQAVMDLGATVCVPRRPRCPSCPVARHCLARASGRAPRLPRARARPPLPEVEVAVGIVRRGSSVLVGRRPREGLLGGLWEFPGGKRRRGERLETTCRREIREETGLDVSVTGAPTVVRQAYSHFRVTIHAFPCRVVGGRIRSRGSEDLHFVRPASLGRYAFPAANRRILAGLGSARG
jgi:A/G-specific adenine glycosylase